MAAWGRGEHRKQASDEAAVANYGPIKTAILAVLRAPWPEHS